jgi:hypothetical protein
MIATSHFRMSWGDPAADVKVIKGMFMGFGCLQSPARYLGNEFGAVRPAWESADVRFSLTYPESYEVGASNLGHIILYSVLNDSPGLLCDRAYFPGKC